MNIRSILDHFSRVSTHWRIQGLSGDGSHAIFLTPIDVDYPSLPPYQLLCILEKDDSYIESLFRASEGPNSNLTSPEIEQIVKDIVTRLDSWNGSQNLRALLEDAAIGSRIHLSRTKHAGDPDIWMAPNIEVERRYLPLGRLRQVWSALSLTFPPILDFQDLQSVVRLHDSVSIVVLPNGETAIFKGAIMIVARMYHELRELLRMAPHPNIISRPKYLVTRRIRDRMEPVVCGFILEYHAGGNLQDIILKSSPEEPISMDVKIKWIRQLISVMRHIHGPAKTFYSDLRPENLVLTSGGDIVLVDFEQFGSPPTWLPPVLWNESDMSDDTDWAKSPVNPVCMPASIFYSNPPAGYFEAFANATDAQRQAIENYTLAKVIWCIFEEETNHVTMFDLDKEESLTQRNYGTAMPQKSVFPHFRKTPMRMRYWIWLCTCSSPEWRSRQCTCPLPAIDVCGRTGAKLQPTGAGNIGIEDTHRYFEASLMGGM